jgi:hypothetical protein
MIRPFSRFAPHAVLVAMAALCALAAFGGPPVLLAACALVPFLDRRGIER